MLTSLKQALKERVSGLTRRQVLQQGGLLAFLGITGTKVAPVAEAVEGPLSPAIPSVLATPDIYRAIGVKPIINCRGTFTIIGGSCELPEVQAAQLAAAKSCVHLDELAEGIGKRLAELTQAEWGLVTCGCASGLYLCTMACLAGGNPELAVRVPHLEGFPKDEVIIPSGSRNQYDAAVRATGVKVITVSSIEELEKALGPKTAMIYMMTGGGSLSVASVSKAAKAKGVPVVVDAAAEILTIPNVHLQAGATIVAYSGGKCLRGPQSAGLMLGDKNLLKAAWVHGAPHHGPGRHLKVGKEEAMGMLMAVEQWTRRNLDAEFDTQVGWLEQIAKRVTTIDGVTTSIRKAGAGLGNRSPSMSISWDQAKVPVSSNVVSALLYDGDPRIELGGGGGGGGGRGGGGSSIGITSYQMLPTDWPIVADRIHAVLSNPPKPAPTSKPEPPAANLTGKWEFTIDYQASQSKHTIEIKQADATISGTHQGNFVARPVNGSVNGDTVTLTSRYGVNGDSWSSTFTGKVAGDTITGNLSMGEYLGAKFSAKKLA